MVNAAAAAGSLGFLATGGAPAAVLHAQLAEVTGPYGVNLFTRQAPFTSLAHVERIAAGHPLPEVDLSNGFDAKFAALLDAPHPPAVVSATFGPFSRAEIEALHARGIAAWITVTNPEDARTAAKLGADALVVQGPEAGGHRSTWTVAEDPDQRPLPELVRAIDVNLPLVAAGGVRNRADAAAMLALPGVVAVACGSAFLLAEEAGTSVASRAFSGRVARGLATDYTRQHPDMPPVYPYLRPLTLEQPYCLVGEGVEKLTEGTVAELVSRLMV